MVFKAKHFLTASGRRVRQLRHKFQGARGYAWLDVSKTEKEFAPAKWLRRAERWTILQLREHPKSLEITADMRKKVLLIREEGREEELGGPGREGWAWFPVAGNYLTPPQLTAGENDIPV